MGTSYSSGDSDCIGEEHFHNETTSHWNTLSKEMVDSPDRGHFRFSWTGLWAMLPTLCFSQ